MKICVGCNTNKPINLFYFDKSRGKHKNKCKECENKRDKIYRSKPEIKQIKNKRSLNDYYEKYEHYKKQQNERLNKPEVRKVKSEYDKQWYAENKKLKSEYDRLYYKENKDKKLNYDIKRGHTTGNGQTIPEKQIEQWLIDKNFKYEKEYSFDDCLNGKGNKLFFDFYLPELNMLIEFDGIHHFESIYNFDVVKLHDQIKNKYCENKNIKLIRIPYFKSIKEELNETFIRTNN